MIRKFCRILCVVFLIGGLQSSQSQHDTIKINLSNPKMNNGSIAVLNDAFHQASIRLIDQDVSFGDGHICSGSLISTRVVLTAARCLFNKNSKTLRHPSELIVVMGTINRYQRTLDTVISGITHIRHLASFDLETLRDDIALLFLSREIPENHLTVRPIQFNLKPIDINLQESTITGWEIYKNGDMSQQLMIANVSIVERISCFNDVGELPLTKGVICTRFNRSDKGICQSDVGAPLVHAGELIGLASWTTSKCSIVSDQFAVHTDVAYHKDWIRRELSNEQNTDSSAWGALGFLILTWFAFREKQKIGFRLL